MKIEPYGDDVPMSGPDAPVAETIDALMRVLATIRYRFGNTAVTYSISWGGSALHARGRQLAQIEMLEQALALHHSMVMCGEKPSETSQQVYKEAMGG